MENHRGVLVPVANQFTAMLAIVQDRAATQLTAKRAKNHDPGVAQPKVTQAENHDHVADPAQAVTDHAVDLHDLEVEARPNHGLDLEVDRLKVTEDHAVVLLKVRQSPDPEVDHEVDRQGVIDPEADLLEAITVVDQSLGQVNVAIDPDLGVVACVSLEADREVEAAEDPEVVQLKVSDHDREVLQAESPGP